MSETIRTVKKLSNNVVNHPLVTLPVEITIEKLSDIEPKKIHWLWPDIIAYGKITLFAGEPSMGKSQLLLYIASILSRGQKFHFQSNSCDAQNILLISGEDNADDTIKPRLMALDADFNKIDYVRGIKKVDKKGNPYFDVICLVEHLAELEDKIIKGNYKLIIIDPITLYLGSIDETKNKEIRSALSMIGALAERHNLAVILNSHFTKPSNGGGAKNAIYRIMGSVGLVAACRIVFGIMKDPEDDTRRLFLPIKNNIGNDKIGFVYKMKPVLIKNDISTCRIDWIEEKITKTANEILNTEPDTSPKLEEAKNLIKDLLKDGSMSLSQIRREAESKNISVNRLYKAKNELNILETDSFMGKRGKIWMLSQT